MRVADSGTNVDRVGLAYFPHIDGLRAIAVLTVLLFHLEVPGFSGGFIGVDVFFVISGFLITRLIWREVDQSGKFSFKKFYVRRMRRLLPALCATLGLSALAAALLLSPERLQQFGWSLSAAALSVSNILFWRQSGYFDIGAVEKPLLHTWSLSVEEQFYLIWPALLLIIGRGSPSRSVALLAVLAIGSLAIDIHLVQQSAANSSMTFFLTPFRAYEFAIGGFGVFILGKWAIGRRSQEAMMALGLTLILFSSWAFSSAMPFPSYYALVPCIGALLVILSPQARLAIVLTNPLSLGIGLISYSAYLVHWPLIVFTRYYTFRPLDVSEKAAIFLATFVIAAIFYFVIEQPFRHARARRSAFPGSFVKGALASVVCLTILGAQMGTSAGWPWRNDKAMTAEHINAGKRSRGTFQSDSCYLDRPSTETCHKERPVQALVIGNSHEVDGYNILRTAYGHSTELNLMRFGNTNNCMFNFVDGVPQAQNMNDQRCRRRVREVASDEFLSTLDIVVLSAYPSFGEAYDNVWKTLAYFQERNPSIKIVVLGTYFGTSLHCTELIARYGPYDACKDERFVVYSPFDDRERSSRARKGGLDFLYVDASRLACPTGAKESCAMSANGEPAFYDRHHLSLGFARFLGERLKEEYGDDLSLYGFPDPRAASKASAR